LIGKGHANTVKRFLNILDSSLKVFVYDWKPPPAGREWDGYFDLSNSFISSKIFSANTSTPKDL
jgi:hypothetical protein